MSPSALFSRRHRVGVVVLCLASLVLVGCGGDEPEVRFAAATTPEAGDLTNAVEYQVDGERPLAPADGQPYRAPDGSFALSVASSWRLKDEGRDIVEAVWFTDPGRESFEANVNVLIERLSRRADIDDYLAMSIRRGSELIEGFSLVDSRAVRLTTGEIGGRLEYEGQFEGVRYRFLAIASIEDTTAAVATYTDLAAQFEATADAVEPYLLTLGVGAATARAVLDSRPGGESKQKQSRKKAKRESKARRFE